jgi:hypothetical protein
MAITQPLMSMTEPGVITIEDSFCSNSNFDGLPNSATFTLQSSGRYLSDGVFAADLNWISPKIYANTLYVKVTREFGTSLGFSGTLGSWIAMSSNRSWSYTNTANNQTLSGAFTAEFSPNSNGTPVTATLGFSIQASTGLGA